MILTSLSRTPCAVHLTGLSHTGGLVVIDAASLNRTVANGCTDELSDGRETQKAKPHASTVIVNLGELQRKFQSLGLHLWSLPCTPKYACLTK